VYRALVLVCVLFGHGFVNGHALISLPKMLMLTEIRVFLPVVCCGLLKRVSCITLENTTFMWPPSSVNVSCVPGYCYCIIASPKRLALSLSGRASTDFLEGQPTIV